MPTVCLVAVSRVAAAWTLGYAIYRSYYALGGTIGMLGGTIAAGDHRLTLPPGAVLLPTTFTVTAPASEHVELQVHARGHDSFHFLLPARITISYDRCGSRPVDTSSLAVWHYDEVTGLLLELMDGSPDAEDRSISFPTSHLSGFIIVN